MISRDKKYSQLAQIALSDFADIVEGTVAIEGKLRILLRDESFIDIWLSIKKKGYMVIIGKEETLMGLYIDIITFLTKRLKNSKLIQSIFITKQKRM